MCCFYVQSVNALVYSGLLQTSESSGTLLSCSIALMVLLMSKGLDGNDRCHALLHAALGPVVGRGSIAARAFPSSADWREQKGDKGALPLFGSGGLLSAPCVSKETVFQVVCWDFTGLSSLTAFLPFLGMDAVWTSTDLLLWHVEAVQSLRN